MTDKGMDPQVVIATLKGVVDQVLSKMSGVVPTSSPESKEIDILEYEGRMRVVGMEKFNAPSFIATVNYYLTEKDSESHKAKGAMVVYVDSENAGKFFKTLGFTVPDDEDDESMMNACGELCNLLGGGFKNELSGLGYADMYMSSPSSYKNSVTEGIEYSQDQNKKYELSFYYWKRRALIIEVTMGVIPLKK